MKKKIISLILILMLALNTFGIAFGEENDTIKINIIHSNDTHGRVEENSSNTNIGFAKIASIIKQTKKENPNTLVVDAGDTIHGMPIINISKGDNSIALLEAAGYDFMVPGNHDFNYGQERLLELSSKAKFKILNANIVNQKGDNILPTYDIVEFEGVKIAIFGLTTPETAYKTSPDNVTGLTFNDPIEVSKKMVEELKNKADIIIALSHIGLDKSSVITTDKIAESVEGIDIIIDGHSHTTLENGMVVKNTLIAQTGEHDKNIGLVTIEVKDKKIVNKSAKLISYDDTADIVPDEIVSKAIEDIKVKNEPILAKVVAKTDIDLDGARENVRVKETNLGNLSADAVKAASGADIGFVNGGNIRISLPIGDITFGQVSELFPFGNTIQVKKITASDLIKVLEHSVSGYPAAQGGFLHVSGLTFEFDPSKEAGSRVSNIVVNNSPIDMKKEYTIAINDFLGIGGDGYDMLIDYPIVGEVGTYEEAFAEYLNSNGTKGCEVTGRIKVKETSSELNKIEKTESIKTVDQPKEPIVSPKKEEQKEQESKVTVVSTNLSEQQYKVQPNDALWKIAQKYNTTWQELSKYNNLSNPHLIYPGQIIKIPAGK